MYDFYCPVCNRKCENEELDLQESGWFGEEWSEIHILCDSEVEKTLKITIN